MLLFLVYGLVLAAALTAVGNAARDNPRRNAYWAAIVALFAFAYFAFPTPTLHWRLEYVLRGGAIIGALLLLRLGPPRAKPAVPRRPAGYALAEAQAVIARNALGAFVFIGVTTIGFLNFLGAKTFFATPVWSIALTVSLVAFFAAPHAIVLRGLSAGSTAYYLGVGKVVAASDFLLLLIPLSVPYCPYVVCPPALLVLAYSKPAIGIPLLTIVGIAFFWQLQVIRRVNPSVVAPERRDEYQNGLEQAMVLLVVLPIAVFGLAALLRGL
jgi:hypothetical protein